MDMPRKRMQNKSTAKIMPADERYTSLLPVPEDFGMSFSGNSAKPKPIDADSSDRSGAFDIESLMSSSDRSNDDQLHLIREEIEYIIENVLPEEVDSVDEMMAEFQGREEELLESLRKMQARHDQNNNNDSDSNGGRRTSIDPDDFMIGEIDPDDDDNGEEGFASANNTTDLYDQWQDDLEQQQQQQQQSFHEDSPNSNPQSGAKLKSPPEQLHMENDAGRFTEEKKNDYSHHSSINHDEDDMNNYNVPHQVQTNSMINRKVSLLSDMDDDSEHSQSLSSLGNYQEEQPTGRKTVALVKLRVWDPAQPNKQWKCMTATKIIVTPLDMEEASGDNDAQVVANIDRRKSMTKRLSIVKEEPEIPPYRGESYYDSGEGNALERICKGALSDGGENADANNEHDVPLMEGGIQGLDLESRGGLRVGTLVGIHIRTSSNTSISSNNKHHGNTSVASMNSSINSNYSSNSDSLKKTRDWKIGNAINIHAVNLLPLPQLSTLHTQMVNNHSSIRELVLDGLPPAALAMEEAELLLDALGTNTSVKRLSMRYSHVENTIASMFALALVDNTSLTQLSLEGNQMTTVAAKNFYSVLRKDNDTLRLLDLSKNPLVDDDVELALDQFMEQRALKRTLTNKAEKARRAARGMPPDAALDEDDNDEGGVGQVTVVCLQETLDGAVGGDDQDDDGLRQQEKQPQELVNGDDARSESIAKPYPGEDFRDYMQRMDQTKERNDQSQQHQQQLMDESMRERNAFDNFAAATAGSGSEPLFEGQEQDQYQFRGLHGLHQSPPSPQGNGSTGSSITTRSANKQGNGENAIIITAPDSPTQSAASGGSRDRAPPVHMSSIETQDSVTVNNSLARRSSIHTIESSNLNLFGDSTNDLHQQKQQQQMQIGSVPPNPYHNTQSSKGSGSQFELNPDDYMDEKAGEREMRRALATSGGAVGVYHIDEAAPSRQNRSGGARQNRMGRSESQRLARLAQLDGSDGDGGTGVPFAGADDGAPDRPFFARSDLALESFMSADVEQANGMQRQVAKLFSVMGLGDEDSGTDRIVCGIVALLLFGLLVMVIIIAT